jgi:osmotically-inducible protein OsmY
MRKQLVNLLVMASLVAGPGTFITGCAVMRHQETAGEYGSDSKITARIKTDLYKDHLVKGTEVNVSTMNGVVQLSGFVESQQAKDRAGEIARSIPGVADVHNDLVLPTGRR